MNSLEYYIRHKKLVISAICICLSSSIYAQNTSKATEEITIVFNKLVRAYGNAKAAPELKVVNSENAQNTPAIYYASPSPTIKVDAKLYSICGEFGADRPSALAVIIAHELAHYYNDHTFCTDFAFAVRKDNSDLSNKLKTLSKSDKLGLETEADHKGLFYACMAGYKPFDIYPRLLDNIYKVYNLPETNTGYPTKQERKDINEQAQQKITELYQLFKQGVAALDNNKFDAAINAFNELNKYFPSRENYNNLGVAKTLKAIQYKTLTRDEYLYPERFTYPLGTDRYSRLNHTETRSVISNNEHQKMLKLLKEAQSNFEKAISLDPGYIQGYINLACVFDFQGNSMAAIGKIMELSKNQQSQKQAQRILAIAYWHAGMEEKAEMIWINLKIN